MSLISKAELSHMLPHSGSMCLLDSVLHWDSETIRCTTNSHRSPQNPLRRPTGLETICGLEYSAQAMGVHIALTASTRQGLAHGYLGAIKTLNIHSLHLDKFEDDLEILSEKMFGQEKSFIYSFTLKAGTRLLLEGRASIFVSYLSHGSS